MSGDLTHPWYTPKRDGPLENYLESRRFGIMPPNAVYPLFKGYEHFQQLWDKGYLEPNVSCIRLMWNIGRHDEHFGVIGEDTIEGIELPAHSGRPGRHSAREILSNGPCWEVHYLRRPHPNKTQR